MDWSESMAEFFDQPEPFCSCVCVLESSLSAWLSSSSVSLCFSWSWPNFVKDILLDQIELSDWSYCFFFSFLFSRWRSFPDESIPRVCLDWFLFERLFSASSALMFPNWNWKCRSMRLSVVSSGAARWMWRGFEGKWFAPLFANVHLLFPLSDTAIRFRTAGSEGNFPSFVIAVALEWRLLPAPF